MSHVNKGHDNLTLDHDISSKIPSKSSQPPIATVMANRSMWDYDRRVYLTKKYRTQIASGLGVFTSVLAGSPFENVKTRMQSKHFQNAMDCIKYTYRTEGVRGFWAGTLPPLASLTVSRVMCFTVYQKAKYYIDDVLAKTTGHSPLGTVNTPGTYPDFWTTGCFAFSGAIAGGSMAILLTPFELIKNATQTSVLMAADAGKHTVRVGTFEATKQIIQRRGFPGLWTGFQLHFARDTAGSAIYFGVYEAVKQSMTSYWQMEKANTPSAAAAAGVLCGIGSWVATYPLDTMKTRVQNTLVGSPSALSKMAGTKTAFEKAAAEAAAVAARSSKWKGVEMMILRSSIQNAIQMVMFETIKTKIIETKFSTGGTDLPKTKREKGKDRRVVP